MENKGFELWQQWMIEDSRLFDEVIEANKKTELWKVKNCIQHQ